jgi:NAD(P)-dependent dehydrogenase (short-subunit alcohol dehydrogenase family)
MLRPTEPLPKNEGIFVSDKLRGKVVVITGGGTGIGLGIAQCCAAEGALLVLAQRRTALAEAAAAELRATGAQAIGLGCDVRDRAAVHALLQTARDTFGPVDVLVNNAALTGAAAAPRPFLEESDEHWRELIDVNLNGAFICTQEAARQMAAHGNGGVIINISSVAQYAAQEHAAPYCAAKAALDGLTKAAAIELAPYNIRVNAVAPGDIDTAASHTVVADAAARGASGRFFRVTPLGRRGTPAEVGAVVAFLAGDEASFVTGATWLVDGGFLSY